MVRKLSFFERLTGASVPEETEKEPARKLTPKKGGRELKPEPEEELLSESEEGELAVDVYQTPDDIVLKTMVAGVRPEDLDLSITRDMVTIKGKREESHEVETEDFFHKELYWGSFSRTVLLPQEIDVEAAEASEKHGLLIIKLPKIDKDRQTKLKVKSN
ncbi:MAG: HSP20 family protein [Parcubacteria group bacterium Gr01-1014_17]|nr:MAG: HSP20 family protein [Parcubacteria group bacterium Gr01-1014_17]